MGLNFQGPKGEKVCVVPAVSYSLLLREGYHVPLPSSPHDDCFHLLPVYEPRVTQVCQDLLVLLDKLVSRADNQRLRSREETR